MKGGVDITKILIKYGTIQGQTAKIAEYMANVIRGQGYEAQALDLKRSAHVPLEDYDAVIIGDSIHMGEHEEHVADFVRQNRVRLERLPSAFFSVSLAAHGDMENARSYVENFELETGWIPLRSVTSAAPCSTSIWTPQMPVDEEHRPRQARQPQPRHVTRS
jgi:menaquinone-dependent protoporphyrinogen oxidase